MGLLKEVVMLTESEALMKGCRSHWMKMMNS